MSELSTGPPATRIRVLQLTGVSIGGSAEHMLLLAKNLDRSRFEVHMALWRGGPLDHLIAESGVPVHFLDKERERPSGRTTSAKAFSGGKLRFLTGFWVLVRLLRSERYDIVQTHTSVAGMLGRLAAVLARVPVRVHMLHSIASNDHVGGLPGRVFRVLEKSADKVTTHYVAGSDAIAKKVVDEGLATAQKVTRIHYSLDLERFERDQAGCDMRSALGGTDDDVIVSLVGRLEDQKGVEYLLDAASQLLPRHPMMHIAIVGEGSLRSALESQAERLGIADRVTFTGWLHSIGGVMSATDIMVIPSRWEAFGIVNLEAMAAGVPVVGFAVEGIPEVVEHGVTGFLADAGDLEALIESLGRLVDDPDLRASMGAAGRRRLDEQFLPEQMVQNHQVLFERLMVEAST